jgi:hypothetical protein
MSTILGFDTNVRNNVLQVPPDKSQIVTTFGYYVKSKYVGDMTKNDFIFLDIPELSHTKFQDAVSNPQMTTRTIDQNGNVINISTGNGKPSLTGVFTGITMDVAPNTVKIFKNNDYPISISYDPPLSQVSSLTMNWYDKNRKLVNFQGLEDNAVILRFTVDKDPPKELDWIDEIKEKQIETLPAPPIPKPIKEKKVWGRWFLMLIFLAFIGVVALRRVNGPV